MPRVKLPNGEELLVIVRHEAFTDGKGKHTNVLWLSGNRTRIMSHRTVCTISSLPAMKLLSTGIAKCSTADQFRRRTGFLVSLRKATAAVPKDVRKSIWDSFMGPKSKPSEVNL